MPPAPAPPVGRPPKSHEWDPLRKGYFHQTTGARYIPGESAIVSARQLGVSERAWLIPHGDIDKWTWPPSRTYAAPTRARESESEFALRNRAWSIVHYSLDVGALGGCDGLLRCSHCNAPKFCGESRMKCCLGRRAGTADWSGPFCTWPHIPHPTGQYEVLWYNSSEDAKHFRNNARMFNCLYAFSSLHAERERHPGKPVFQLKGQV
jgi:hypothetical protein